MNNSIQSLTRLLLFTFITMSLTSGCSLVSKKQNQATENARSGQWYECARNSEGNGWNCGSGSGNQARANVAVNEAVNNEATTEYIAKQPESIEAKTRETGIEAEADSGSEIETEETADAAATKSDSDSSSSLAEQQGIYTIQVGAFAGETKRDNFIVENDLQALQLSFYESVKDGRTWWVLTYGEFSDISGAKSAAAELDDSYGISDIWIRPLDQLTGVKPEPTLSIEQTPSADKVAPVEARYDESQPSTASRENDEDFYDPHYSIQLAAFKTEQKREQFVADKGLSALQLTLVTEGRLGETWWIALYGEFETVQEARLEQAEIEAEYSLSGTWIKPVEHE